MSPTPPRYSAKEFLDASDSGDSDRMTSHMLLQAAATEAKCQAQARVLDRLRALNDELFDLARAEPKDELSDGLALAHHKLDEVLRLLREEGVTE